MLPCTSFWKALIACPPSPRWNLPLFTAKSVLSSPCSRYNPSPSPQGLTLAHLDSLPHHYPVIWTNASAPFLFDKGGFGVLANCSLCCTEATFSFLTGSVCSSFSAEAGTFFCWSRQHHKVCHFSSLLLLSDFCSVLVILSSSLSFLLPQSLWKELFYFFCSIWLQWVAGHSFFRGNDAPMSWPNRERQSFPLQSLVVSLLLSLVYTLLFSRTGGVLSHLNSSTHSFPRFPPRNLCSLVYAATDTAFC